ncbi:hypothetical protein FOA52_006135 [Chlamydomonas sp. UWO 241]|nr:hypothetical protein FOA52_006135 [Chlamydomonas sp. UWO 241]
MMRPSTAAATLALLLLVTAASAWEQTCGACTVEDCNCLACALPTVELGNATGFVVLAGQEVTTGTSPKSEIFGNLGVFPGSSITGDPDMVNGSVIHLANGASGAAIRDLTTAYNDAAGRVQCPVAVSGDLGGLTLYPGLYKSTDGLKIEIGDLTLDAKGNTSAVFIFQMATTFLSTTGRSVLLAGNATASNIFWQVGTSATLMSSTVLEGTMMADQSITSQAGAVVNGRVLAREASVTMLAAVFTLPSLDA